MGLEPTTLDMQNQSTSHLFICPIKKPSLFLGGLLLSILFLFKHKTYQPLQVPPSVALVLISHVIMFITVFIENIKVFLLSKYTKFLLNTKFITVLFIKVFLIGVEPTSEGS